MRFVPVLKSAVVYPLECVGGPLGYERDDTADCPILLTERKISPDSAAS